jgi:lysine 2,3-aminomutase
LLDDGAEDSAALLAAAAEPDAASAAPGASGRGLAGLWALRRASLFDARDPAVLRDGLNTAPRCRELRLCAGPAGAVRWERPAETLRALRARHPEAVLRLELWACGGIPALLPAPVVRALRAARPVFVHVWIEAEAELTPGLRALVACCVDAGLPVAAELPVRRGAAAAVPALRQLCLALLELRARPYVLVDPAWLPPAERLAPAESEALVRGLRGWISGLAVPQLVEESPAGARVPRIPGYVAALDAAGAEIVSYSGSRHRYPNPPG